MLDRLPSPLASRLLLFAAPLLAACTEVPAAPAAPAAGAAPPYAAPGPLAAPTLFAPGVVSGPDFDSHVAFEPDGRTLYFVRASPNFNFWAILQSRFEGGAWREPEVAPFSGQFADADPFPTPDGKRLYFVSRRPVPGRPKAQVDIWVVDRGPSGWGEPRNLGAPVNSDEREWYPTLAADGTLYFGSSRPGGRGQSDLYRARPLGDGFAEPENLGDAFNTEHDEFEPFVAPDQSYLIFMAGGRADGLGGYDLYISYNRDGSWTKAQNMGAPFNSKADEFSPKLSPDGRYFFWASARGFTDEPQPRRLAYAELMRKMRSPGNGLLDVYQIDVAALKLAR
jgi:Tol biopolymer transport system component